LFPTWYSTSLAKANGRNVSADPLRALQVNVVGTANVLQATRTARAARFILASSIFVYAAAVSTDGDEDTPYRPTGAGHVHTTNFIAREFLTHDYAAAGGTPFTILRLAPVYGPRMWPGLAVRAFIDAARAGGPIVVFGDGTDRRPFIHVDDLADACVAVLGPAAKNRTYNVLGPRSITVAELASLVAVAFPDVMVIQRDEPARRGELSCADRELSADRIYGDLGWRARIPIEEGVARSIANEQVTV